MEMKQPKDSRSPSPSSGSQQARSNPQTELRDQKFTGIRRELFLFARELFRLGETPILIGPFIASSFALFSPLLTAGNTPRSDTEKPSKDPYPYQNMSILTESGGSFINLGVQHNLASYRVHKEHIQKAIEEADIVLLEGGNEENQSYFNVLKDEAFSRDKRVIDIDMTKKELAVFSSIGVNAVAAALGAVLLWDTRREESKGKTLGFTRRSILRAVAYSAAMLGFPSPPHILDTIQGRKDYPTMDFSYISDGRTVKMLDNVLKVIEANPGKQILAITGNNHARGFRHYLASKESFEGFKRRRDIYFSTYEKIFGRDMQELKAIDK